MSSRPLDDATLERALRALGRDIDYPRAVDVSPRVMARLRADNVSALPRRGARWQPTAAAVFIILLVGALTLTAVPGFRQAVADLLGFEKARIEVTEEPLPELPEVGSGLALGQAVTAADAEQLVGIPVPILDRSRSGDPDGIYVARGDVPILSVVYGRGHGLPAPARQDVSVLTTAMRADLYDGFTEKVVQSSDATVTGVFVRNQNGYWIQGDHAFFVYTTANGVDQVEMARIADNVLIWQEGSVIYRIEGELTRRQAMELASSMDLDG
jgi:hypothetical protein